MNDDIPPPVMHALNCLCRACTDARRHEAAARLEELAGREGALLEALPFKPLKKPPRGSLRALVRHSRRCAS